MRFWAQIRVFIGGFCAAFFPTMGAFFVLLLILAVSVHPKTVELSLSEGAILYALGLSVAIGICAGREALREWREG